MAFAASPASSSAPSWRSRWPVRRPSRRRRSPAGADRARHARVRRDAAGGGCRRGQRRRWRRAARRRAADAGRAAAARAATTSTSPSCCRPRTTPIEDNGIKFFAADGYKLTDEAEHAIERALERERAASAHVDRPRARAARRPGGLPARAAHALCRARPERRRRAAGLRQRRDVPRRAGDLPPAGRQRDRDRRRARRAQHQRRLRLHARRRAGRAGRRRRPRARLRLRRRRRPRARRRPRSDRSSTATSCSRSPRCTCATPGGSAATASR